MYRDQLAGSAHALSDADIISHLITSLPESWNVIQAIIANQPIANTTLDSVILSLNNFELQLPQRIEDKPPEALVATTSYRHSRGHRRERGRGQYRGRGQGRIEKAFRSSERTPARTSARCWYCHQRGHKEENCWVKQEVEAEEREAADHHTVTAGVTTTDLPEVIRTGAF